MKKLFNLKGKLLCLLTIAVFTFNGCKKDVSTKKDSEEQLIQKAKNWYEVQTKNLVTSIGISVGKESKLTLTPDWDNAKVVQLNGVASISTELRTNIETKAKINKYFALVIKIDGNIFESKILNIKSSTSVEDKNVLNATQLYQTAFSNGDLSKEHIGILSLTVALPNPG